MTISPAHSKKDPFGGASDSRRNERGAALAIAVLMMVLLSAIALGVLAVVQGEAKIASADLKRTEACYASAAALEIMTNKFSALFAHTSRPSTAELQDISDNPPTELTNPTDPTNLAYTFPDHTLIKNTAGVSKTVNIPYGPFAGLIAGLTPYRMTTTAQSSMAQCKLTRDMNNYLIPLFQFGMFSDKDIELHPGPDFTFNGRVHANGNIYVNGSVKFLDKVTTANELIYDTLRNGNSRTGATVSMQVGAINVKLNKGSMMASGSSIPGGPNLTSATATPLGQRGYFPDSPTGIVNPSWNVTSVATAVAGQDNKFGGQLLTRTTGGAPLKLPLQMDGSPTREIIKRSMPNDVPDPANPSALSESRYHTKSRIRILIDDENPTLADSGGIPVGQGVSLSAFDPVPLPNVAINANPALNGGGRALWAINDNNTSVATSYDLTAPVIVQQEQNGVARQADTVRGVKTSKTRIITGVSNPLAPAVISITCNAHGYATGNLVRISGVEGVNPRANGEWTITVTGVNTFTLNGRSGAVGTTYIADTGIAYKFADIPTSVNGTAIPAGGGITGRILIQIENAAGTKFDVTTQILSMGMTVGEPNSIVHLQRPLWAAFTQGSRDASVLNGTNNLVSILNSPQLGAADGEINVLGAVPSLGINGLTAINADADTLVRNDSAPSNLLTRLLTGQADSGNTWASWNAIVPINLYNMREGHLSTAAVEDRVYDRGITGIVELNMKNLARWIDGVYDNNLLAGTNAVSGNIEHTDGYIIYVSDRRGDKVKSMTVADPGSKPKTTSTYNATNGMVDNVDIYGQDDKMDAGEDVQNLSVPIGYTLSGIGLRDLTELPDPLALVTVPAYGADTLKRAIAVAAWTNQDATVPTNHKYFRNAVRLFNGETLQVAGAAGRLSTTHGLTVSTENLVYIWGNYNTTGINQAPPAGESSLNSPTAASHYCPGAGPMGSTACASGTDTQVPASIVGDAFFPLSKTWFDGEGALYLSDYTDRRADRNLPAAPVAEVQAGTAVRAGIIAGNNLGALEATGSQPDAANGNDSRLNGGMHNFPRFLEDWLVAKKGAAPADGRRWNFVGSFIPLYNSTQAMGQWWYVNTTGNGPYGAPERNWAFDSTFLDMDRLPPGTPMFQYIAPTAFRQVL